jgi:predicted metal-dependent hydrolase
MTHKSPKIAQFLEQMEANREIRGDTPLDRRYLGYFACFNKQLFYEAHDVLEDLWLLKKGDPIYLFYKGLIQLAGAFVHLSKGKTNPAARLFRLAQANLGGFAPECESLDLRELLARVQSWIDILEKSDYTQNPYDPKSPPRLSLKHE